MDQVRCLFVLISLFVWLTGCNQSKPVFTAEEFSPEDLQVARHAIPMTEISLMVRSGYDQGKILADVRQRHVPALLDSKSEQSLIRFGAKPELISALKNEANVLTKRQKQAFDQVTLERDARITTTQQTVPGYGSEKLHQPVRKTMPVVRTANPDTPEEAYWKAEAAYRTKKSELEAQISSQQGYINRMRSRGYHESYLASAVDQLHQYEDELKNLQAPIR